MLELSNAHGSPPQLFLGFQLFASAPVGKTKRSDAVLSNFLQWVAPPHRLFGEALVI